jgi:hypothetical protein
MTDTCVIDLNSDFVGFRWGNFNVFNRQLFASFPSHCGLL